jgi:serine phosphatase RsbU (regulator of sigma subunit)
VDGFYGAERPVKVIGSDKHPSGETVADELLAAIKTFQRARLHDDIAILVIEATP